MRPFGLVTRNDITNEARAVSKLCSPGTHTNIVEVFRHERLPFYSPYYYLDMEYCQMNLEEFIDRMNSIDWRLSVVNTVRTLQIVVQILNGVAYIHDHNEVHRDLKPRNGKSLLSMAEEKYYGLLEINAGSLQISGFVLRGRLRYLISLTLQGEQAVIELLKCLVGSPNSTRRWTCGVSVVFYTNFAAAIKRSPAIGRFMNLQ